MFVARRVSAKVNPLVRSFSAASGDSIQLYQYAICPFCNRVKALLDYARIEYSTIEVNPLTKAEIKWSKDYRKVPIATAPDDQEPWLGSDVIIEKLLERNPDIPKGMSLDEFSKSASAQEWSSFATEELASLLYPNMCRTLGDSFRAFGYVDKVDSFSTLDKYAVKGLGSLAMYMAASRVKKKRNITDERAALDEALQQLETKGLGGQSGFVSGMDEPNLGDLNLFGTLRSIEGLPAHDVAVQARGGPILEWYQRMTEKVDNTA